MTDPSRLQDVPGAIIAGADRCVKCGLCLPHCPTYGLTRNEADSPRGRIALAEALARGALDADPLLLGHLDGCLLCRRCESVCPSQVAYGALLDQTRALTLARRPRWLRWAAALLSRRRLGALGIPLGALLPARWLPGSAGLARAARQLRRQRQRTRPTPAPATSALPRVALFLGCVGDAAQPGVRQAARGLLQAAGVQVEIPSGQGCCGAMHAHLGDRDGAARLAARNQHAFAPLRPDAIISLASGCGTQLDEQQPPLPAPHRDISHYLQDNHLLDGLRFAPLAARVLLHTPCSLANTPGGDTVVTRLLGHIPGLQVSPLTAGSFCCGAAGLQLLSHPAQGAALRAPKLAAIRTAAPDILVTSNPGCALHLLAGLEGPVPEVLHPVELLYRQLMPGPG